MSCRNCGFVPEPQLQNTNSSDNLVSQILRGQRPLLDSDHALLNAEMVELEQLQSLYAAQLEEIRLRRRAVLRALKNRKSIYAPIRRLPRDILIEIFHSVCDSWWQGTEIWRFPQRLHSLNVSGPLWMLGRVCGIWRDTLHSSPASWARKLVVQAPFSKYAPEILQTYLKLTGDHFLRLRIDCREPIKDDIILSLLVQSYQRWKNLRIFTSKHHMRHFESISQFPALQAIDIHICDVYSSTSDYHLDICTRAPQLWQASLRGHKLHHIKLPPWVTHFSGTIIGSEDLRLLSKLPKLRKCHLWTSEVTEEAPVVTVEQLTHLYVDGEHILNFLSAPLLRSLTICPSAGTLAKESIIHFLHRSRCHLESLSIGNLAFTSATLSRMFALEACSTISRLKLSLHTKTTNGIVKTLASPSVLLSLPHLILCISRHPEDEWTAILRMARSCRDAGLLKLFEVQFEVDEPDRYLVEDIRALTGDNFEMRVEKWDPPSHEHLCLMRFG